MKTKTFIGSCVLFLFLLATLVNAQTSPPELIFYQGIARDASGNPLVNQPIGIQLKIHQGAFNGPVVFTETHAVTTNSLGLFSLQIGSTNSTAFQLILWNNGPYFLEVLMDPNGGSAYTSIGTQQLLSVPYALYSKSSYSSAIAFGSYTTQNAPPISISSNTSATSTTLTLTQGSNTSSVQIDFPAPPSPSISITSASPSIVSVFPPSGNAFTISATSPSFTSSNGITNITGTYPNYIVTTTPTLSISGDTLSISGGNTVILPTAPTPTIIGQGIANVNPVSGNSFIIDVPSPTLNIIQSTPGQATFSLSQGTSSTSQTLTFPPSSVTLYGSGIASVSPNGSPSSTFTVNVPSPTLSANSSTAGVTTITINQGSATNTTSFNILPAIQNNAWGLNGNTVTSSNYLGTNNAANLIFKTNNTERMRISSTGEVGIGPPGFSPSYPLHVSHTGTFDVAAGVNYTYTGSSSMGSAISVKAQSTGGSDISGGYFQVNGSSSVTAVALKGVVTSSAQYNIGIDASATGATGTNYGGYFYAANGSTNNYGIYTNVYSSNPNDAAIYAASTGANGSAGRFYVTSGANTAPALFVSSVSSIAPIAVFSGSGNVGINTNNPTSKLSVIGDIDIPGTNSYKYTSPKTYTLSIHPSVFSPENSTVSYTIVAGLMGPAPVGTGTLSAGYTCYYQTPLMLPQNATITAIYAHVIDNDGTYNISQIQIFKNDYQPGTSYGNQILLTPGLSTSGSNSNIQQIGGALSPFEVVNNSTWAYSIRIGIEYPGPTATTLKTGKIMVIYQKSETD